MTHLLSQYHYDLPSELIGRTPAEPRDSARLFVYDTKTDLVTFDTFRNISNYLPQNSLMVLNDTGVIPARIEFTKDTSGKLEGLMLVNEGFDSDGAMPTIVGKQLYPGRKLAIDDHWFVITRQDEQKFYLKPEFDPNLIPALLEKFGTTPTPYYLGKLGMTEHDLRTRYQTTFSKNKKSVAAPTASLHFTDAVFESLKEKGIETAHVTLDVGLGTFADIEQKNIDGKFLHYEKISIPESSVKKIRDAKSGGHGVIAVGTTVVRTLESQAKALTPTAPLSTLSTIVERVPNTSSNDISTETNIFIMPGHEFKIVDHLITNFHVPESSLMALVDAFLIHKKSQKGILDLYKIAIENKFRFYSFGDSMLIL